MNTSKQLFLSLLALGFFAFACDNTLNSVSPNGNAAVQSVNSSQKAAKASSRSYDRVVGPNESIQSAVNQASSGDHILVDGGIHAEQLLINKNLTLTGRNGATITQPSSVQSFSLEESGRPWKPLIFAFGGSLQDGVAGGPGTIDVTIRGLTIDGESRPANNLTGILFRNVKSSGGIHQVTVENMEREGSGSTFGLIAYGDSKVTFANNTIKGIERGGIGANGDGGTHPAPQVTIRNNIIVGSDNPNNAPNGIQIGYGATGRVMGNTIREAHYPGPVWKASGILIFESDGVKIHGNTVRDTDRAIAVSAWGFYRESADGNSITGNTISGSNGGIVVQSKTWNNILTNMDNRANNNKITNNRVEGTGSGTGIHVYAGDHSPDYDPAAVNNKVIANRVTQFGTAVITDGTGTKVQANNHPFNP